MNLKHRVIQKWMPINKSGLDPVSAYLFGCYIKKIDGSDHVEYFECRDCSQKIAGFELRGRNWSFETES